MVFQDLWENDGSDSRNHARSREELAKISTEVKALQRAMLAVKVQWISDRACIV